jgi:hypothetical protein
MNEEELTSELKTKYILINSKKNSDKVVLI